MSNPFDQFDAPAASGNPFDQFDTLPTAPPAKRPVGAAEAFGRSAMDSMAAIPSFVNALFGQAARPVDALFGTNIRESLTDPAGPVEQARKAWQLNNQTEQLDGTMAQVAQGLGPLPRDMGLAIMTGGGSLGAQSTLKAAPMAGEAITRMNAVKSLAPELLQGAKAMMAPAALSSRDTYNQARTEGADPMQAAALGTVRGLGTVAQGALPLSAAGNLATRVGTGAALNLPANMLQTQAENAVAPESMQRNTFDVADNATALGVGAIMSALLGPRAGRIQTPADISNIRRTDNMNKWGIDRTDGYGPELAPLEPAAPRAPEPYAADPYAVNPKQATADLNAKLFPAPDEAPDLKLVPKVGDGALFSTKANPDPASIPSKLTLEGDGPNRILSDGDVRNIDKVLGMSEAEVTALPRPAQEALRDHANSFAESKQSFDIADRRQRQADADLANTGQIDPDYQGGGAAARGGAFDAGIRRVTLLDGELPVTLMDSDGKKATVAIDQNGKQILVEVDPKRITEHDLPANQRMAQDFNARSSEPPSAVGRGTMASENMPRRSTDRIAGDQYGGRATPYNPNPMDGGRVSGDVLPPDAGTSVVPAGRGDGDTINSRPLTPQPEPARLQEPQQPAPKPDKWTDAVSAAESQWGKFDRGQRSMLASQIGYGNAQFGPKKKSITTMEWDDLPPNVQRDLGKSMLGKQPAPQAEQPAADTMQLPRGENAPQAPVADHIADDGKMIAPKSEPTPAETPINPDQKGASLGQEKTAQEVLTKTAPKEADPTAGIPKGLFTKVKDVEYDAGSGKKVGTAKEAMRDLNRSLSDYQAFLDCLRG
jgi:hypothetical protein